MGRRRGFLGALVRDMEKSANRSAADRRRQERRLEAVHSRALEREMVRFEREHERYRIRVEREAERRRIDQEREQAARQKQDAKEAQLSAWRLEYEEHQERDLSIDRIANDAPEVEDRERLYAEVAEPRTFEPVPFVPPSPPNHEAKARTLRQQADMEVKGALDSFRPETRTLRRVQLIAGMTGIGGIGLQFALADTGSSLGSVAIVVGLVGVIVAHLVASDQATRQRRAIEMKATQEAHARLEGSLAVLDRETKAEAESSLQKARLAYEDATASARAEFDREEGERQRALQELRDGNTNRMREALEATFPLELPVPCNVRFTAQSSTVVALELDVPEPSALPTAEAKLLASGKVSYKEKTDKRLREQYLRLVVSLALRNASEAMLNVPTCQCVELRAFRTMIDPSIGGVVRRKVLDVRFDYPTLAPMTMEGIDPVLALKHFEHTIKLDKGGSLQPVDATP